MLPFDILRDTLSGSMSANGLPGAGLSHAEITGVDGDRKTEWCVDGIKSKWARPNKMIEALTQGGLIGKVLTHTLETSEGEDEHVLIIGNIDDPLASWAVMAKCSLYKGDEGDIIDTFATLSIFENRSRIEQLIHQQNVEYMRHQAQEILDLIQKATGGDREKLDSLRQALKDEDANLLLGLWETQAQADTLQTMTPRATKSSPSGRL